MNLKVYYFIKRVLDIIFSFICIIVLSPLFLLIACMVFLSDFKSPFFIHKRKGKGAKDFYMVKFRTMYVDGDKIFETMDDKLKVQFYSDFKLEDDPRIMPIGKILRATSLDELPQFINVLKGDMSIVGPRPIIERELEEKYSREEQEKLLSVRPGVTGYWQVYGRNGISYDNGRAAMELMYIDKQNILLDFKLVFKTIGAVIKGEGQ